MPSIIDWIMAKQLLVANNVGKKMKINEESTDSYVSLFYVSGAQNILQRDQTRCPKV